LTPALPTESVENNSIRRQEEDIALVVAPILDGKIDTWKAWIAELNGARSADLKDMNQRMGLTRHAAWLAETPMGAMVAVLQEGSGADTFMQKCGESSHEFDKSFAAKILEIHGMDVTQPPPGPMPELYLDSGS
jgi:hypothetical protein